MSNLPKHFRSDLHVAIMEITPELAADWLKHNTGNRNLNAATVEAFSAKLRGGLYRFNGDTIRFSIDGRLLDAQHRLAGCVEANIPFTAIVAWGIDPESQITMDRGRKRTLTDHLRIMDEHSTKELATVLNLAVQWTRGVRFGIGINTQVEYEDAYEFLKENPSVRDSVAAIATFNSSRVRRLINPAHFAFCHWVLSDIEFDDAFDFFERLVSGNHAEDTEPAFRLRVRLDELRKDRADRPEDVIPLVFKAWNFYRAGDHVKQLRIRRGGSAPESFPEPK